MEKQKIIDWIIGANSGSGYGSGDSSGYGFRSGYGNGTGYGSGTGDGDGSGSGCGSGYGDGSVDGSGYGYGIGDGSGNGYGYGSGSGYGYGISSFCGETVYIIDEVQTIVRNIVGNLAKGAILNSDMTLTPCYIVRDGRGKFAHGETVEVARIALEEKILRSIDEDEAIEKIIEKFGSGDKHTAAEFYNWHHYLTGSCELGRKSFMKNHGIQMDDLFTIDEFIELTKNDYGADKIEKLRLALDARRKKEDVT